MKQTKKWLGLIIAFALILTTVKTIPAAAQSSPVNSDGAVLDWTADICKVPGEWGNTTTSPIIIGDSIYAACDNYLYKLEKATGKIEAEIELAEYINYSYTLTYGDDMIFVPINNGKVQAVSTKTDKSLWVSESFDGFQSNSPLTYENGKLYSAIAKDSYDSNTWEYLGSEGYVFCLDTADGDSSKTSETKKVLWKSDLDKEGHYWAKPTISGNYVLVGTDASSIFVFEKSTGELKSSIPVNGQIRSGILKDPDAAYFYAVTKSATLYRFKINSDGSYEELSSLDLTPADANATSTNCTSTPTILNGNLYLFNSYTNAAYETTGLASVVTADMKIIRQIPLNRSFSQSTALVIPAKLGAEVYFTQNNNPSGIYHFKDFDNTKIDTIFEPETNLQQYCCSSVVTDENGTLFYSNDSGTIFSVGKKLEPSPNPSPSAIPTVSEVPSKTPAANNIGSTSASVKKPEKVKKLTVKKSGKKVIIKWKKVSGTVKYQVMVKKGTGKFKKLAVTSKTSLKSKLKKGSYKIKVRAYQLANGQKIYGNYSSVKKLKIK